MDRNGAQTVLLLALGPRTLGSAENRGEARKQKQPTEGAYLSCAISRTA